MMFQSLNQFLINHISIFKHHVFAYNLTFILFTAIVAAILFFVLLKISYFTLNKVINFLDPYLKNHVFINFILKEDVFKKIIVILLFKLLSLYFVIIWSSYDSLSIITEKAIFILQILLILSTIKAFLRGSIKYLKTKPSFQDKPLESYVQIITIILYFMATAYIYVYITNKSLVAFFTTIGAISAILLLIFKDMLLGIMASIQLSSNDMLKIGDWITFKKYGADGIVIEINLTTVKVENFDKTVTTIPTYSLIADAFQNWRYMEVNGNRLIKRHIKLKPSSIYYMTEQKLAYLKQIEFLKQYIEHKEHDINLHNNKLKVDKSLIINGRHLTNLGLFRKYVEVYLQHNTSINKDMTLLVRQLQSDEYGVPIEVYCFSKEHSLVSYEHIQADIFDHIYAATIFFDLVIYER